jgi:membrane-associated phospholipid phosphatase
MMHHRSLLGCTVTVFALAACSEKPTAPSSAPAGASPLADRSGSHGAPVTPASVIWETRGGALVAARSLNPIVGMRAYGLLGMAGYAAAVAAGGDDDLDGGADDVSHSKSPIKAATQRGAVAGASAQVLRYLFPLDVAQIESLVAADEAGAGTMGEQIHFARGVALGRSVGDIIVKRGISDGLTKPDGTPMVWDPSTLRAGPTLWAMDLDATPHVPAGFQFPAMHAYYLPSNDQFRPPPPPADQTPGLNEVISIVQARTPAQAAIARFWNFTNGSILPGGYWDTQAFSYILEHQLGEQDAAHVLALVNSAGIDATIGCWDAKYHYLVKRPWQLAPIDLPNSALIIGRPNHPSYPSGHSCVSSAMAAVLKSFFPEKSATLDDQVTEAGMSRIYAGIHYRSDIDAGRALGTSVAAWAIKFDHDHGILSAVMPQ